MGNINLTRTLFGADHFRRNVRAVQDLKPVAQRHGKSLAQLALRWTTSHPAISVALAGCRTAAEVEQNAGAVGWSLSEEDLAEIDDVFERHGIETAPDTWIEDDGLD
jgi:aryl-alcohol dehydrogenase-like predicted oxidoreductase